MQLKRVYALFNGLQRRVNFGLDIHINQNDKAVHSFEEVKGKSRKIIVLRVGGASVNYMLAAL
ncbi:hypothetical protein ABLV87_13030 [Klebsiella sp. JB_Kp018]|uniref:hypothetical protein n=1 Tax=Klebsiella TaxID=570 RepID=UPI002AB8F564|nr:hypothetical protein [Klebsiella variicola]MDZ0575027.1 hypothetical protein [Klebsiella variicola]